MWYPDYDLKYMNSKDQMNDKVDVQQPRTLKCVQYIHKKTKYDEEDVILLL